MGGQQRVVRSDDANGDSVAAPIAYPLELWRRNVELRLVSVLHRNQKRRAGIGWVLELRDDGRTGRKRRNDLKGNVVIDRDLPSFDGEPAARRLKVVRSDRAGLSGWPSHWPAAASREQQHRHR